MKNHVVTIFPDVAVIFGY